MTARRKRLKVGILFGGRSAEHEVSVVSAQGVMAAIDTERFQAVPIGVTRQGTWLTPHRPSSALDRIRSERLAQPGRAAGRRACSTARQALAALRRVDVVFPLIHGTNGEDGTLQGFLELAGVPYVGAGVAASALGMDKALQKTFFRHHDFPVADDVVSPRLAAGARDPHGVAREAEATIGYPAFVKPANSGSSIGTSKARSREDLDAAIAEAFRYDRKVLVEQAIEGRARWRWRCSATTSRRRRRVGEITFDARVLRLPREVRRPEHEASHPGRHPGSDVGARCGRWPSPPTSRSTAPGWRAWTSS